MTTADGRNTTAPRPAVAAARAYITMAERDHEPVPTGFATLQRDGLPLRRPNNRSTST